MDTTQIFLAATISLLFASGVYLEVTKVPAERVQVEVVVSGIAQQTPGASDLSKSVDVLLTEAQKIPLTIIETPANIVKLVKKVKRKHFPKVIINPLTGIPLTESERKSLIAASK